MHWKYTITFNKIVSAAEGLEFPEQRRMLSEGLKTEAAKLPDDEDGWLKRQTSEYAECIALCEDIEEVDAILEEFYDFADESDIWLGL